MNKFKQARFEAVRRRGRMVVAAVLAGGVWLAAPVAWAAPITFSYTGSLQSFVAPEAGTYVITAYGAQGGSTNTLGIGGLGAEIGSRIVLSANELLSIIVGGTGGRNGGGGGSFVFTGSGISATPLVIAGGGGGAGALGVGSPGQIGMSGSPGAGSVGGAGGQSGLGGGGGVAETAAGGGGGFYGAGGDGTVTDPLFVPGGGGQAGSAGAAGGTSPAGTGGYGGGGGGGAGGVGGGGGGGYSGGGGGGGTRGGGGGGGSFLALGSIDPVLLAGVRSGNGLVTIEEIAGPPSTTVPEPASLALLGVGVAGMASLRKRMRG